MQSDEAREPDPTTVIITGAAGNLGSAVVARFRLEGARLVLMDRSSDRLRELYPTLVNSEHRLIGEVDLTDAEAVSRAIDAAAVEVGGFDLLVNTVGLFRQSPLLDELSLFDLVFRVNVLTAVHCTRAALPHLRDQGSIVSVASDAGLVGRAGQAAYSASKAAVLRITESLADELAANGIRVNAVLPGAMNTPQNRSSASTGQRLVPLDAVADAILFLGTGMGRGVTGVALPVTHGR